MLQYCWTWLQAHREEGQDLAEYALLLALIAILLIAVIYAFSGSIQSVFNHISNTLKGATTFAPRSS